MSVVIGRKSLRRVSPSDRFEKQVLGLANGANNGRLNDVFWISWVHFASSLCLGVLCHTFYQSWLFHAIGWTFNFKLPAACQSKGSTVTVSSYCDHTASLLLIFKYTLSSCIFDVSTVLSTQVLVYLLKILLSVYILMYFYNQFSLAVSLCYI